MASRTWPRSPRYSVPYIHTKALAAGAILRGPSGQAEETIVAAGETCEEIEKVAVEVCRERGVPQTDRNIVLKERT